MNTNNARANVRDFRGPVVKILLRFSLVGIVAIIIYAIRLWHLGQMATIIAIGTMTAVASMAIGGVFGFIFAIPKMESKSSLVPNVGEQPDKSQTQLPFNQNTNLEQISDWLTKIIIGIGLIELKDIATTLSDVATDVARGLGNTPGDYPFALALILYFLVCGFLIAYLWTSLYLPEAFVIAQQRAKGALELRVAIEDKLREALESHMPGKDAVEPDDAKNRLEEYMHDYEKIRQSMPAGSLRTAEMTNIVASVRSLAKMLDYGANEVENLFNSGTEGKRIAALALIQELRLTDKKAVSIVNKAIGKSGSAFEQYQALRSADVIISDLKESDQKKSILDTIMAQRSGGRGKYIVQGTDRWILSEKILKKGGRIRTDPWSYEIE